MADKSKIEWTDASWNPVTGCTKVSPGCANCYAERLFPRVNRHRFIMQEGKPETKRLRKFSDVAWYPSRLDQPLHWRRPRKIFVCSMADLFHEDVPDKFIFEVFGEMGAAYWHTFQVLTKRPERMLNFIESHQDKWRKEGRAPFGKAWRHVWIGVSCEDQQRADERIPVLLQTPAAVRFLSCEPLLDSVDLNKWFGLLPGNEWRECLCKEIDPADRPCLVCEGRRFYGEESGLSWVIAGGESGPKARPMDPDWARSIRDQCAAAAVPFFMKQMSGRKPIPPDLMIREFPGG